MISARGLWFLLTILNVWWIPSPCNAVAPRQPIGSSGSLVADWVYAKSSGSQQLWKYQGALYDPLDGRRVASVEGLEWVSLLRQNETAHRPIYSQVLQHPNATWNCAATMWSKHLFCYTTGKDDGNGNGNQTTLLRKMRIRPYSPEKTIPLEQAAAVYETATTFIERPTGEVLVHSEWPSLHSSSARRNETIQLWGVANTHRNADDGTLGFSVYCKRRSPKSPLFLPDLASNDDDAVSADGTPVNASSVVVSPQRARWIQFGGNTMETKHKFGARETYSMNVPGLKSTATRRSGPKNPFTWLWIRLGGASSSSSNVRPKLQYTRYGEGPPFYAPGRMCMLELQAEPISSIGEASPVVQQLLQSQVEGWMQPNWNSWESSDARLQLLPEPGQALDRWTLYKGQALAAWERVRSVTNIVSFFRKEHGFWRA